MQANLAKREPEILERWQYESVYERVRQACANRPAYWLIDGPPYANGDIHIGHAVNKVLKDMMVKAMRLDGRDAAFRPGWDCHGLPIELQVEKKFGKVGQKIDAPAFRVKCREYASEQVRRQREDFKRLGVLADWDHPYLTMQPAYEAEQLRVLARIVQNGHIVRGFKPVHWCLDCSSALAEAEVEYADKTSTAVDVIFGAEDSVAVARCFHVTDAGHDIGFVIWTTTPWSLPGNQAIQVAPDIEYVLAHFEGRRLIVAAALLEQCAERWGGPGPAILGRTTGLKLVGLKARHPFAMRSVPLIPSHDVTVDDGTGLVHSAPAHGTEDYAACSAAGIPIENPVGADGRFLDGTPVVGGLHLRKAEAPILSALEDAGALLHQKSVRHSYPHCWRHKTPLVTLATPQWFMSMDAAGLRDQAIRLIDQTRFIPSWGRERMRAMVTQRPDWCISRQRTWGVPLALFVHRENQMMHPDSVALLYKVADRIETEGLEVWFQSEPSDWLNAVDASSYVKCTDTLDVWFDSGCAHQCAFEATEQSALDENGLAPQADLYLEGSDQHRGWFQSSLLTSVAMRREAPYRAVLTHGFTVDESGRKMSKSVGNVVAPQQITKTLGADVLRLWVASSDYSGEIAISEQLLRRTSDAYRRMRNTLRYLLGNLHDFEPLRDAVDVGSLLSMDRWAINQAMELQQAIIAAYCAAEFHVVYQKLRNYCVVDMGGLYLDVLKDRLYTMSADSLGRRSAQTALFQLAEMLVRWINPILSFTADEAWVMLPGDRTESIFAQVWYEGPENIAGGGRLTGGEWLLLRRARDAVNKFLEDLRVAGEIGGSLDAEVCVYADGAMLKALQMLGDELRFWFITSEASVKSLSEGAEGTKILTDEGGSIWVTAVRSEHRKCARCWHRRPDIGIHTEHAELCGRCVENVSGVGEERLHV